MQQICSFIIRISACFILLKCLIDCLLVSCIPVIFFMSITPFYVEGARPGCKSIDAKLFENLFLQTSSCFILYVHLMMK